MIKSPGGLYGGVSVDMLGSDDHVSTSRNRVLAALLAALPLPSGRGETICENRGSGIPQVMELLREAGMSPPTFDAAPGHVKVTVPQHALLSPDIIGWIGALGARGLTDPQQLALAMMRTTGRVNILMLQAWGIESPTAGMALRDLVARRLAVRSGGRRYAGYQLAPPTHGAGAGVGVEGQRDAIVQAIRAGHTTTRALSDVLGINHRTVTRRLAELSRDGTIEPTHAARSRKQSYRLATEGEGR